MAKKERGDDRVTKATSKHLSKSSRAYLNRQFNDPYVLRAKEEGYRSRAAFKLLEIQEKYHVLDDVDVVVDLGCAPGSWCQVVQSIRPKVKIIGMDLLETDPLEGCVFLQNDFSSDEGLDELMAHLPKDTAIDVVMSDLAANTMGHRETDGLRTQALVELAAIFARENLKIGGHFVTKMFMHGGEKAFALDLQKVFEKVHFLKPSSSRKDSREIFLVAKGYLGEAKKGR
ncbi:MAG: rRNA methyltransferase [Alphaproteobacteria bacterium CG_4_10_14_0_8_um_filter_53_9]|nr:MAG: rRNA methyltransferase [Alphaproteobacteria bacterium CG_4_10_14_0_8_um_filter_53_9]